MTFAIFYIFYKSKIRPFTLEECFLEKDPPITTTFLDLYLEIDLGSNFFFSYLIIFFSMPKIILMTIIIKRKIGRILAKIWYKSQKVIHQTSFGKKKNLLYVHITIKFKPRIISMITVRPVIRFPTWSLTFECLASSFYNLQDV